LHDDLRSINENSWLFGDYIIKRTELVEDEVSPLYKDNKFSYMISEAPDPRPATTSLPKDGPARLISYDPTGHSCAWVLGGVILRVRYREPSEQGTCTEEVDTLKWIQKQNFSFATPQILHFHTRFDRSFTIRTMLPGQLTGQRVADKWIVLSRDEKNEISERITELYLEMAKHTSNNPTGVDGKWHSQPSLCAPPPYTTHSPCYIKAICKQLGYDCNEFVLAISPLAHSPGLMVIMPDGSLGVTEFDHFGYLP
ncbi:hypothetical protein GQ53DRAFT_620860, partial [Thozetella sp. PMI_491]